MKHWIGLFLALIVTVFACTAGATLDPSRADADAVSASSGHHPFCDHSFDLTGDSRRLCGYSHQIPDCQSFADECARDAPKPPSFPAWLVHFLGAIASAIGFVFKKLGLVGVWLVLAIVLALVLYPIVQAISQSRRDEKTADPLALSNMPLKANAEVLKLSRDDDPARVLEEANLLAQQGKLDHALYRYLHAALLSLDKKGAIVIARETTHGEYVRACNDTEAKPPLRDLVREIDLVRFGGREASTLGVATAQERATRIVRRAMAAGVMLVAFLCAGCGQQQALSGNDPTGSDTLRALLEKQNVEVKTLPQSLVRVPIPTPQNRESTPAIYVDVDRIPLEAEAQEHLLRWVEAGGILVLAGSPTAWPAELKAKRAKTKSLKISVTTFPNDTDSDTSSDADDETSAEPRIDHGTLANPAAVSWVDPQTFVLAETDTEEDFAVGRTRGAGAIYGIASDDIFTNAGLSIPGNPGAAIAILANVPRQKYLFAPVGAGYSPPTNPFAGLINAGLALPLLHGLFATIILFFAVGMRLAAPLPDAPPQRRAFTEHIYATAAVYDRTRSAKHALASFGRYAETRLSKKLHRSAPDIVTLLSQRSGETIEECAHLWNRAMVAREGENDPPNGDELKILGRLTSIYSRTMQ